MAKTLIVYFSLTGHTRQVVEEIARLSGADVDPIVDAAERGLPPAHLPGSPWRRSFTTL